MRIFWNPSSLDEKHLALIERAKALNLNDRLIKAAPILPSTLVRAHDPLYIAERIRLEKAAGLDPYDDLGDLGALCAAAHHTAHTGQTTIVPTNGGGTAHFSSGTDEQPYNGLVLAAGIVLDHDDHVAILDCTASDGRGVESCLGALKLAGRVNYYSAARWFNQPNHALVFLDGLRPLVEAVAHSCPTVIYVAGCGNAMLTREQAIRRDDTVLAELRRLGRNVVVVTGDGVLSSYAMDVHTSMVESVKKILDTR